jgi:tetratricopeptide (TPR) repeat protein
MAMYYCSGEQRHAWDDAADAAKCCNGYERAHRVSRRSDGTVHLTYYWRRTARTRRTVVEAPVSAARPLEVPHDAFFKRLGEAGPGSQQWQAVSAGLVAVRLVERCATRRDASTRAVGFRELLAVRRAIRALDDGPIRTALGAVIDAVAADASSATARLIGALSAYGQQLEADGEWRLAADVFGVAIACAITREDRAPLPASYFHMGLCRRKLGDIDGAQTAYQTGRVVAERIGDTAGLLRLDVGEARMAIERGNYPEAERRLDAIIDAARGAGVDEVAARALHDRGLVAFRRDQNEAAVRYYFGALRLFQAGDDQERALHDIALALLELGARADARRAFEVLFDTAVLQETKWAAAVNLVDVAARESDWPAFESWRARTAAVALPPVLAATFAVVVGDAYRRFGQPMLAIDAYQAAIAAAAPAGLHEYVVRAEAGRQAAREVPERMTAPPVPLPDTLSDVVAAVEAMFADSRRSASRTPTDR